MLDPFLNLAEGQRSGGVEGRQAFSFHFDSSGNFIAAHCVAYFFGPRPMWPTKWIRARLCRAKCDINRVCGKPILIANEGGKGKEESQSKGTKRGRDRRGTERENERTSKKTLPA